MNLGLKNKIAVVTGASAGLGRAIAFSLAREGANVAICGRRQEVLEQTAMEIKRETQTKVLAFAGDMTQAEDVRLFIKRVINEWGTVHILVNNVGQATRGCLDSLSPNNWQQTFEVNIMSAVLCTNQVTPVMKAQKWGRIINISALSGKEPGQELIASNVVKSGLIGFSKTLSRELALDNILVNCISPGLIDSPQNDRYFSRLEKEEALSRIPLHRFGDPQEFADVVAFLCSQRSSYITGVNLLVDGGASHSL
ncbi:MAG: SDR family oxidoreductase [Desulfobacteraceae bacterium]|nr:SDR family oxidoreductase [Desulfobacteraceae bacterium]